MKKLTILLFVVFILPSVIQAYATIERDLLPLQFIFYRYEDPNMSDDNLGPHKSPHKPYCPVSAFYDINDNVICVTGDDDYVITYTTYDETGVQLETGVTTLNNGTANITLSSTVPSSGGAIELSINGTTYIAYIDNHSQI